MSTYTVHQPPAKKRGSSDPERFVFVRDGFSFWAFVFGPLWMLRHRMWLTLIGYIAVVGGLEIGMQQLGVSSPIQTAVGLLIALLIGFEAGTLRRFTLARRKWRNVGVIVGDDREVAEQRFFDSWVRHTLAQPAPSSSPSASLLRKPPAPNDVIGLFPEPRAPR